MSLLSVDGKIFFSILSQGLTEFLMKNSYVDTSVQKGGIPGVPGCLGHTGVVTQLLDYYGNFRLRVIVGSGDSDWNRLEKDIIIGCTILVILFALAMNMIAKSAEVECRAPLTASRVCQPPK